MNINEIVSDAKEKYGIDVIWMDTTDEYYIGRSACTGRLGDNPQIMMGMYEDKEREILSLVHEMAHIIYQYPSYSEWPELTKYELEIKVWYNTYKLLNDYKIYLKPETVRWGHDQLSTYIGWEEREVLNYTKHGTRV